MRKLTILLMILLPCISFANDTYQIPINPFLANSIWPIAHANSYAQASVDALAPTDENLSINFASFSSFSPMDPIALVYSSDGKTIWGSSFTSVFTLERSANELKINAKLDSEFLELLINFPMHGAYCLLANINDQEQFMMAKRNAIDAYVKDVDGISIKKLHDRVIPYINKQDSIVGLSMSYDGWLIYVTHKGIAGALSKDFKFLSKPFYLPGNDTLDISNSFALDDKGGVYIVSNQYMQKIIWNENKKSFTLAWKTPYEAGSSTPQPGRLGTGSGSTPTLMGDEISGLYVVITDGAKLMNLVVFDAKTGQIIAKAPVNFGDPTITQSTSEQSVLVHEWRAVVVNNQYKDKFPIIKGDAPLGIQQFEFDVKKKVLIPTWHVNNISIPNGIPTMSKKTNLMYGIAKKPLVDNEWGLVGIDWSTGQVIFFKKAGSGLDYNSAYAATEIGLEGEVISGTALGIVRFKPNYN